MNAEKDDLPLSKYFTTAFSNAVGVVPILGQVASAINDLTIERRLISIESMIVQINEHIKPYPFQETKQIDRTEMENIVLETLEEYLKTQDLIKKEYYSGLVAVSLLEGNVKYSEKEFFIRKIASLSNAHLTLLRLYGSPKMAFEGAGRPMPDESIGVMRVVLDYCPEMDKDVIRSVHSDLFNSSLVNANADIFGTMLSTPGIVRVGQMLTPLGERFVKACHPILFIKN